MLGWSVATAVLLVAVVLASGLSWLKLAGVGSFVLRRAEPNNTLHNQALHPTARRVVDFPVFSLDSKLVVTGGRRVSLAVVPLHDTESALRSQAIHSQSQEERP